ncbi:MAG TPA: RdgB/HAM1 family non-canonical purine NTP pyrophosphatase [Acidimicrobiia bacterium]
MTRLIVVASQNPDKVSEVEAVLAGIDLDIEVVRHVTWPGVQETEPTLEGNALLKAAAVAAHTGLAAVADDTGLEVAGLGGAPGVHTARFAGDGASYEDNVSKLLADLVGVADRSARFRTVVALVTPGEEPVVAEGVLEGTIAAARRGAGGFGYDPVFEVDGETLAEMGTARKNEISHRARALRALAERLAGDQTGSWRD